MSFLLDMFNEYEPMSEIGAISGPVLVLAGVLLLLADLGTKTRVYRLFLNPSSWISKGTWFIAFFIVFGLGYSLPALNLFAWLPWSKATLLGDIIGWVAAVASVLILIYTGFVLSLLKRIPFWRTPALPILFLSSGLCAGIAYLLLMTPFLQARMGEETVAVLRMLMIAETGFILIQLLTMAIAVEVARHGVTSAIESVHLLKTPLFIGGVITAGLLVPLCLLFYGVGVSSDYSLSVLAPVIGILLLAGAFLMRYVVIRVGVCLPLYSARGCSAGSGQRSLKN